MDPKPAILKLLEGNPGRRPIGEEPIGRGELTRPEWAGDEICAVWDRIVEVVPLGLLSGADEEVLLMACYSLVEFHRLARVAQAMPEREALEMCPAEAAARRAIVAHINQFLKCATRLGLSPIDRARMAKPSSSKPDPLAEVLSKKPDLNVAQTG